MFRTMSASLRSHRARLAMTALAVALGTGLMCGSFVFTATLTHSLDALFAQSAVGTDVEVRHVSPPGAVQGAGSAAARRCPHPFWPRSVSCRTCPPRTARSAAGPCCSAGTARRCPPRSWPH